MEEKESVELFPPYVTLYNQLKALFGEDPEIEFDLLDDATRSTTIRSSNGRKLMALQNALNLDSFETLGFHIEFEYTGPSTEQADTVYDLFNGNPHFSRVCVKHDPQTPDVPITICYFKDETIQYSADSRFVPNGYRTILAEQLIPILFKRDARKMLYITEEKVH